MPVRSIGDAIDKGHGLYLAFFAERNLNGPLGYRHYGQLGAFGWRQDWTGRKHGAPDPSDRSLMRMYRHEGFSALEKDNHRIQWTHSDQSNPPLVYPSRSFKATGGFYTCVFNPSLIILQNGEGPDTMGFDDGITGADVIPLKHWSDVVFLQWQEYCCPRGQPLSPHQAQSSLRGIMQSGISNNLTCSIIDTILRQTGKELQEYPDFYPVQNTRYAVYGAHTAEGKALIGSPNGIDPAHLLLDHYTMRHLTITEVVVFARQSPPEQPTLRYNLLFRLGPTPR